MYHIKNCILIFLFFSHYVVCAQKLELASTDEEKENLAIEQAIFSNIRTSDYFKKVERECAEFKKENIHPVHCALLADAPDEIGISSQKGRIFDGGMNYIAVVAHFTLESGSGSYRDYLFIISQRADGEFKVHASQDLKRVSRCMLDVKIENANIIIPLLESEGGAGGRCLPVQGESLQFIWKNEKLQKIPARQAP